MVGARRAERTATAWRSMWGVVCGVYDGGWKAGTRDGHGHWRHTNGAGYEGGWRDGLTHGEGFAKLTMAVRI
jgi:hypothetical protein